MLAYLSFKLVWLYIIDKNLRIRKLNVSKKEYRNFSSKVSRSVANYRTLTLSESNFGGKIRIPIVQVFSKFG